MAKRDEKTVKSPDSDHDDDTVRTYVKGIESMVMQIISRVPKEKGKLEPLLQELIKLKKSSNLKMTDAIGVLDKIGTYLEKGDNLKNAGPIYEFIKKVEGVKILLKELNELREQD